MFVSLAVVGENCIGSALSDPSELNLSFLTFLGVAVA